MEWLTILAIVLGPFFGIWVHGKLEERKREYERKLSIFKTLMATRAVPLSAQHVEALNRIDIEFTRRREKNVRDAWTVLLDHYGQSPIAPDKPLPNAGPEEQKRYDAAYRTFENNQQRWIERGFDLRATLLKEMGGLFKYDFDEVKIKRAAYRPKAHGDLETEQQFLLVAANDVLSGRRPLAMHVTNWPEQTEEQEALVKTLLASVGQDGAYKGRIVADTPPHERPSLRQLIE